MTSLLRHEGYVAVGDEDAREGRPHVTRHEGSMSPSATDAAPPPQHPSCDGEGLASGARMVAIVVAVQRNPGWFRGVRRSAVNRLPCSSEPRRAR
jgi:hypothetical protein